MPLVPSDEAWVENIANWLLDGRILVLRGLPRAGKSTLCSALETLLGASAISVRGREFSESTQSGLRRDIDSKLDALIEVHNCAQLLFDDYGHAIRRSQGGALHSTLYRLLVDGDNARDIGALLTTRYLDNIDIRFAGSPLLSRAQMIQLPMLDERDAAALGMPLDQLRAVVGSSTTLARRLGPQDAQVRTYELAEYLAVDSSRIVKDLPPQAIEVIVGARLYGDADAISRQALLMVGYLDEDGTYAIAQTVQESGLTHEVEMLNPGWPEGDAPSIRAFVDMLAGTDDALWIDRYLLTDVGRLRTFIEGVRAHTDCRLRLLSSDDWDAGGVSVGQAQALHEIRDVEIRLMKPVDRPQLHDRHLILPPLGNGFVLPTARVILGRDTPGSAVAVRIPRLPVDYLNFWRRANRI
ncbi:MAG: hypothetical protein HYZ39_04825 [Mycolicibacterium cosmeticum]|nr:hypothetical protein [Mycolicibacterium cosmeticum]